MELDMGMGHPQKCIEDTLKHFLEYLVLAEI